MGKISWLLFVFLLLFCHLGMAERSEKGRHNINPKKYGHNCEIAGICQNLVAINCQAEVDGPFYYVAADTGKIIGYCGGLCMGGGCDLSLCPPKEWTCG